MTDETTRQPNASYHLRLSPHVRACECDGQVILLDLQQNRYLGIGGSRVAQLAGAVEGWPTIPPRTERPPSPVEAEALARPLLAKGLLTRDPVDAPPRPLLEEATTSLNALDAAPRPAVGMQRVHRFLFAAGAAAMRLRSQSLFTVALAMQARRQRHESAAHGPALEGLRQAVAVYETLRPYFFTARDKCLYDSLALMNFLASEGMFPRWVIGVKTLPFGAHSWVQADGVVLNDQHELVRRFKPILVV